jgi:hypothetical protein
MPLVTRAVFMLVTPDRIAGRRTLVPSRRPVRAIDEGWT